MATIAVKEVVIDGISLSSRYDKAAEYDAMVKMVEHVAPPLRPKLKSIFCDSKAQACYSADLHRCSTGEATEIGRQLALGARDAHGGHNGILLAGVTGKNIFVDPDWDF